MTSSGLTAPTHLSPGHEFESFDCGNIVLNDWLKRQARKNETSGASRTYVVCTGNRVAGYYCLAMGAVVRSASPKPMQRNMPDPIPVVVMGRLAVDEAQTGRGIGTALLQDAVLRTLNIAEEVGVKALLVHAISDEAKAWYRGRGFLESPIEPMTLCLVLETARRATAESNS